MPPTSLADIYLYRSESLGFGFALLALLTVSLALVLSRWKGRVVAGIFVCAPSLVWAAVAPGWANLISIFFGLCLLTWTNRASDIAWGFFLGMRRALTAPFRMVGFFKEVFLSLSFFNTTRWGDILRLGVPAILVSGLFLALLGFGNAALAQWVNSALSAFGEFLSAIVFPDISRIGFWILAAITGAVLLVPAWHCPEVSKDGDAFKKRFGGDSDARRQTLQWALVLGGVNLVFLLTNTLDVIYLWIRRSPPQGVTTTEYLYGGVYGLIFATIVAGLLLALIFNHPSDVRKSRWLKGLGLAWIAQNVFLIAGVGFRLWLHIDRFCLTPRRVEVMFFLALVITGFVLLSVFMLREKTFRWLFGCNVLAIFGLFFVVQFLDVRRWCVDSAIIQWRANPQLKLDADFWKSIGLSSWRILEAMAHSDREDLKTWYAQKRWDALMEALQNFPKSESSWKGLSWSVISESRDFCRAASVPEGTIDVRHVSHFWMDWDVEKECNFWINADAVTLPKKEEIFPTRKVPKSN